MQQSRWFHALVWAVAAAVFSIAPAAAGEQSSCADGFVSTSTPHFAAGSLTLPSTAYAMTGAASIDAFLQLGGWSTNLDALHVLSGTQALFSVASNGWMPAANGIVLTHPGKVYHADVSGGTLVVVEDPGWAALGLNIGNVNALALDGDCYLFSSATIEFLFPFGSAHPAQVIRACAGAALELAFDAAGLGSDVDALHYDGGAVEFSFSANHFVPGAMLRNQDTHRCTPAGASRTCAATTLSPGFDGAGVGFQNLDAFSAGGFVFTACSLHNEGRRQISPPCDPLLEGSPCNESTDNYLPFIPWNDGLAGQAVALAATCPSPSLFTADLPENVVGNFFFVPGSAGVPLPSDVELIELAVTQWLADFDLHNPLSGFAYASGFRYKNLVSTTVQQFGCGVATCTDAPEDRAVITCAYREGPPAGPAYPPLYFASELQSSFKAEVLASVNAIRQSASPAPSTPLAPLVWNDRLANVAANRVSRLQDDFVFEPVPPASGEDGETQYRHPIVLPTGGAEAAFASWAAAGALYDLDTNTCAGDPPGSCGEYTQLVHEDVTAIGCWQNWYEGTTWVACAYDHKTNDSRAHTDRPYAAVP